MSALPPTIVDNSVTLTFGPNHQYYGYCTVADVTYEFPSAASYSTLTNSVIAQEISYSAQELHGLLFHYYVVPYAGTDAGVLLELRMLNAKLAYANIVDRYFTGGEPDLSASAAERRGWVESIILDIANGTLHWEYPFGDATPQAMAVVYDVSRGAQIYPSPNAADPVAQQPIFRIGQTRFQPGQMM